MGTRAHVIVIGGREHLASSAMARLEVLESLWSRFRPDSEISRLNAAAGRPVVVSALTFRLLTRAIDESRATGGAFDPTVLPALAAAGYDRDFASLAPDAGRAPDPVATPGVDAIEVDPIVGAVRLPRGTAVDLGGIGKGFAADLVAAELRDAGALGACVNLGGDLRVSGEPPGGSGWEVAVEREPGDATREPVRCILRLADGGIATTSARRRTWLRGAAAFHHVIDPRTGAPAAVRFPSVTVVAADAAAAEVGATAAFLADDLDAATEVLHARGAAGIAFDAGGCARPLGPIDAFVACRADLGAN